jgi:predicted negative regulator of RcsB-dependent stress response
MQSAGTESTRIYDLLAWAQVHRKQVIAGALAVLVVVVIGYIVHWKNKQTRLAATEALLSVTSQASPGTPEAADSGPKPADLLQVAGEYASTSAGERALLLAAGAAYREGDYAQSEKLFEQFKSEHSGSELVPIAALGVATSLDAQDRTEEAVAAYESVIAAHSTHPVAGHARLSLATLFEDTGKPADALRIYDAMSDGNDFSQQAMEVANRRERLLRKHPELAPTTPTTTEVTNVVTLPETSIPVVSEGEAEADSTGSTDADEDEDEAPAPDVSGENPVEAADPAK